MEQLYCLRKRYGDLDAWFESLWMLPHLERPSALVIPLYMAMINLATSSILALDFKCDGCLLKMNPVR